MGLDGDGQTDGTIPQYLEGGPHHHRQNIKFSYGHCLHSTVQRPSAQHLHDTTTTSVSDAASVSVIRIVQTTVIHDAKL